MKSIKAITTKKELREFREALCGPKEIVQSTVPEDKKAPLCFDCDCGNQVDIRGDVNICLRCGVVYNITGEPYVQVHV